MSAFTESLGGGIPGRWKSGTDDHTRSLGEQNIIVTRLPCTCSNIGDQLAALAVGQPSRQLTHGALHCRKINVAIRHCQCIEPCDLSKPNAHIGQGIAVKVQR
jgi:hypothetical protein